MMHQRPPFPQGGVGYQTPMPQGQQAMPQQSNPQFASAPPKLFNPHTMPSAASHDLVFQNGISPPSSMIGMSYPQQPSTQVAQQISSMHLSQPPPLQQASAWGAPVDSPHIPSQFRPQAAPLAGRPAMPPLPSGPAAGGAPPPAIGLPASPGSGPPSGSSSGPSSLTGGPSAFGYAPPPTGPSLPPVSGPRKPMYPQPSSMPSSTSTNFGSQPQSQSSFGGPPTSMVYPGSSSVPGMPPPMARGMAPPAGGVNRYPVSGGHVVPGSMAVPGQSMFQQPGMQPPVMPPGMIGQQPMSVAQPSMLPGMSSSLSGQPGMPPSMPGQHGIPPMMSGQPGVPPAMPDQLGMSGPMQAQQAKRIDPNQMPNPIQVMRDDQSSFDGQVFCTSTRGKLPPLVSTKCRIQDDGNCSPRFMRSTVYTVPCNQDMLKESGIPMALVVAPFASIPEDEVQLRYVDYGPTGPVRCNRCKAYMNPFMQFIDGGRRFVCNICSHSSEVPQEYFCHLDHQGRRVDIYDRPELCFGSYEFIATADYCKDSKFPGPPAFIFMIDVSYQSMQSGLVTTLANELHSLLDELPRDVGMEESAIKVGFVTYNTSLHFYNVKESLAQPQMMVVADLEEAFVPLLDGFLVNAKEARAVVDSLLDMLPSLFKDTRETDVILGPVIAAGIEALKGAGIAGKLFIFHASLPIAEAPGKLKNREDRKLLATDKEKTILAPQDNYYVNLAKECVKNGVSIDMFLFPNAYIDVATIGLLVSQTGGQIYRYSYFKDSTHGRQFISDLHKNFRRELGFDAIMRLRCSTGLRPVEFYGSFMMNNTTDIELGSIDSDKAIAVEIKHDDKIPEDGVTFAQCALLYTSVSGQRRLRIHNMAFATCSKLADLYRTCELDTMLNFMAKQALRQVLSSNPQAIRESLMQRCIQILACYRQNCATPSTSAQLILPECMKLLPLLVNSLVKSDVLAGGQEMSSDDRAFLMQAVLTMPPAMSSVYFYPRVLALHDLDPDHEFEMPEHMRCLGEKFEDCGVYLLENGVSMFLWVGLQVDSKFLQNVFGSSGIGQLDIEMTQLPELDTPLSKIVRKVVTTLQGERPRSLKLTIVRQRDKLEPWFKHYLVEDKGFHANQLSYVDFLCHVHKEIRSLLS